jgi:hypothetical protein
MIRGLFEGFCNIIGGWIISWMGVVITLMDLLALTIIMG